MASTFYIEIITPERTFFCGEVESLIVNTVGGEMGVLKGNIPLVTALVSGKIKLKVKDKWYYAANSDGFLEVTPSKTVIFCQTVFWPDEMKDADLKEKERHHREALSNARDEKTYYLAKVSLMRTMAKLNVKYQHENDVFLDK